jgi:hypothetical protein
MSKCLGRFQTASPHIFLIFLPRSLAINASKLSHIDIALHRYIPPCISPSACCSLLHVAQYMPLWSMLHGLRAVSLSGAMQGPILLPLETGCTQNHQLVTARLVQRAARQLTAGGHLGPMSWGAKLATVLSPVPSSPASQALTLGTSTRATTQSVVGRLLLSHRISPMPMETCTVNTMVSDETRSIWTPSNIKMSSCLNPLPYSLSRLQESAVGHSSPR